MDYKFSSITNMNTMSNNNNNTLLAISDNLSLSYEFEIYKKKETKHISMNGHFKKATALMSSYFSVCLFVFHQV